MDSAQQSPDEYKSPTLIKINSVRDLQTFIGNLNKYLIDNEIHVEYSPNDYRLVVSATVIDDQIILTLDSAESDPFEHDE